MSNFVEPGKQTILLLVLSVLKRNRQLNAGYFVDLVAILVAFDRANHSAIGLAVAHRHIWFLAFWRDCFKHLVATPTFSTRGFPILSATCSMVLFPFLFHPD